MTVKTFRNIKFLGEYKKLGAMGFAFQKMYGGNYLQWSKGGRFDTISVYKRGADVVINGTLTNRGGNFYKMILDNKFTINDFPLAGDCKVGGKYFYLYHHEATGDMFIDSSKWDEACVKTKAIMFADVDLEAKFKEKPELKDMYDDLPVNANGWEKLFIYYDSIAPLFELMALDWVKLTEWTTEVDDKGRPIRTGETTDA